MFDTIRYGMTRSDTMTTYKNFSLYSIGKNKFSVGKKETIIGKKLKISQILSIYIVL
jgi:hypothetical protein